MISKIDFIRNYGIFKNFNWANSDDISEFKEKNIFYGWNYSGKTTLSRLFSSLRDKTSHPDYENASFKLTYDEGSVDNNSLENFPYPVEVFNSEYIKENLRWDYDEHIQAIFFEVGDNAKISEEISKILGYVDSINGTEEIKGKKEKHLKNVEEFNLFEGKLFTQEASRIKNEAFSSLIEFNKGHLKRIWNSIKSDSESFIIDSKTDLSKLSLVVKIENPKNKVDLVEYSGSFLEIVKSANEAIKDTPSKSNIIEILDQSNVSNSWAKQGLSLHKKGQNCIFCDNPISDERFKLLNQYFQNQGAKLKEKISEIKDNIQKEKEILENLNFPSSVNDLNDGYHKDYIKARGIIGTEIRKLQAYLKKIDNALNKKQSTQIYSELAITFDINYINSFTEKLKRINAIIVKNNKFTDDFDAIINADREKYKKHLVASFFKKSRYLGKEKKHNHSTTQLEKLNEKVLNYEKQIERLNGRKTSISEGCVQFNSFVQSFLSRDDIQIVLNNDSQKFNLMRGEDYAQNLSEGEKMAISFSHFLVNLKSIENKGELSDYIIFIDDPISSLDSNHIFQINSLLKDTFFDLVENPSNPNSKQWQILCKQLFVSTHNFEFFTLLKELPKKGFKKDSRYFISRQIAESTINKLPKVYNTFSSEYHYLFGEIIAFNEELNKSASKRLLTIPNILRRFVEMYTLTKYPSNEEVDGRAEKVFGKREAKRILKLLHHFSHFNSIDRLHRHSEFVADIEHACSDLVSLIEQKDELHFEALKSSLN